MSWTTYPLTIAKPRNIWHWAYLESFTRRRESDATYPATDVYCDESGRVQSKKQHGEDHEQR